MAVQYSRALLRVAIAQICQQLGWAAIQSTPLELLTSVLERYIVELGQQSHRYSELFGRTEPNFDDLGLAFQELQISLDELKDYVHYVDAVPFALEIVRYPAPKPSLLTADRDDKEITNVDVCQPMKAELEDGHTSPTVGANTAFPPGSQDALQSLRSPSAASASRPFTSPTEAPASKRQRILPDEAAHSQYEMKSFVRSDSGVLFPTGQGKAAEPRNPLIIATPTEPTPPVYISAGNVSAASVPNIFSKAALTPKLFKEKSKGAAQWKPPRHSPSATLLSRGPKGSLLRKGFNSLPKLPEDVDILEEGEILFPAMEDDGIMEDHKARETRLNAYDDAIDSVIKRAQEPTVENAVMLMDYDSDDELDSNQPPEDDFGLPISADPSTRRQREERDARISDTINAVAASWSQEESRSPPVECPESPGQLDDENEIVEVHSESPVVAELSPKVMYEPELPPSPSPPPLPTAAPAIIHSPVKTLAERKSMPDDLLASDPLNLSGIRSSGTKHKKMKKNKSSKSLAQATSSASYARDAGSYPPQVPIVPMEQLEIKPEAGEWMPPVDEPTWAMDSPVGSPRHDVANYEEAAASVPGDWSDNDGLPSPMTAAKSLMTLASGIVPPRPPSPKQATPLQRLKISFGSGTSRTVNNTSESDEPVFRPEKKPDVTMEPFFEDHSRHYADSFAAAPNRPSPAERRSDVGFSSQRKSEKREHSAKGRSKDRKDRRDKDRDRHHHEKRERSVERVEHRGRDKKVASKKDKSRKEHKKHERDRGRDKKAPAEDVPHIPKMTIKFGGGLSGGTANLVSVGAAENPPPPVQAPAPLKLVIRPLASDSPLSSAKPSPQQSAAKSSKHHRHAAPSLVPTAHQSRPFNISAGRESSQISPVRFTSSSSSSDSDSGSPMRVRDIRRTSPPPSLASPAPLLSTASSRSPSSSPSRSSPASSRCSRSRSRSPPMLYRSPAVDVNPPVFGSYSRAPRQASPKLPAFPSYPPSKYSTPAAVSIPAHGASSRLLVSPVSALPAMPPPALKTPSSSKLKPKQVQSVVTETISKIVDEKGEITWICPACKMPDDGSPMIGCDICDDWYHWPCVGVVQEPPEDEQWFCKRCESTQLASSKGGKGAKKKKVGGASASAASGGGAAGRSKKKPAKRK